MRAVIICKINKVGKKLDSIQQNSCTFEGSIHKYILTALCQNLISSFVNIEERQKTYLTPFHINIVDLVNLNFQQILDVLICIML